MNVKKQQGNSVGLQIYNLHFTFLAMHRKCYRIGLPYFFAQLEEMGSSAVQSSSVYIFNFTYKWSKERTNKDI